VNNLTVSGSTFVGNASTDRLFVTASSFLSQTLTLEKAGSTTLGASQLYINGATSNRIDFTGTGLGAPSVSRSAGTKLVLWPGTVGSSVDYALGMDSSTFWFSLGNSSDSFKWYTGTTNIATISGAGLFSATGNISSTDGSNSTVMQNNGAVEITSTTGVALIDFKTSVAEDYDCRIIQNSNGLQFETGGQGAAAVGLTIDSSRNVTIGGDLRVNGNDIQDSTGTTRLTLGSTNTFTGNISTTSTVFCGTLDVDSWAMNEASFALTAPSNAPAGSLLFSYNGTVKAYIDDGTVAAYKMNFTGQHKVKPASVTLFASSSIGLIVSSVGTYDNTIDAVDPRDNININEALPVVALSTSRNQKSVLGVISSFEDDNAFRTYDMGSFVSVQEKKSEDDRRIIINALGEGGIWVTNINGNLENGDYITSCEIPGYGMKQDEEYLAKYTVAKITCDCTFDLISTVYRCEEFSWNGQTYRKAFVGCTYHCG
jgi:hypothetical protein